MRDIRNLFEYEENYIPVRVSNFWSSNGIKYKSKGDRNKTPSVEKLIKLIKQNFLNKIKPYFKDIINTLKKSDTWKIRLTIAINFISSINNDEYV